MTQQDQEQNQNQPPLTPTFQTANELLGRQPDNASFIRNRNTLFDNPLEMQLSQTEELIRDGYCGHCILTKQPERYRKVTNKMNLFAYYCNVCTTLFSIGTEFLLGMKSLDNFELLSLDESELLVIKAKDRIIYEKVVLFKKQFSREE